MALRHAFFYTICFVLQLDLMAWHAEITIIYDIDSNNM